MEPNAGPANAARARTSLPLPQGFSASRALRVGVRWTRSTALVTCAGLGVPLNLLPRVIMCALHKLRISVPIALLPFLMPSLPPSLHFSLSFSYSLHFSISFSYSHTRMLTHSLTHSLMLPFPLSSFHINGSCPLFLCTAAQVPFPSCTSNEDCAVLAPSQSSILNMYCSTRCFSGYVFFSHLIRASISCCVSRRPRLTEPLSMYVHVYPDVMYPTLY